MSPTRKVLVGWCLLAAGASPAALIGYLQPPGPYAEQESMMRFEIRPAAGGTPGPGVSPDAKLTVKVVGDLEAQIVETESGRRVGAVLRHSLRRPGMRIHTWAFSPEGQLLATASSEEEGEDTVGEVRVWEVATGKLLAVATDAQYDLGRVHTVAFSENGKTVVIHCEEISGK
jgi:hypothetical protein